MFKFMMAIILLFSPLCGMDDDDVSGGHSIARVRTPLHLPDNLRSPVFVLNMTSDDDLCDAISNKSLIRELLHIHYIRPCLIEVIRETKSSPTAHEDMEDTNRMATKAITKALDKQQEEIDGSWSKTQALIVSGSTSIIVGVIVGLVQYFASK